ncbi:hypothetical protein EYC80_010295 [Monilinia laxa]|uniref:F-box domain-containing protein n=1 Tax=Monilinia laxa TaxID=61186 RepID=A0A5N6JNZ2_MONLA|nr:hypothetical protein EYC80_010295 [Monilinia laxa]
MDNSYEDHYNHSWEDLLWGGPPDDNPTVTKDHRPLNKTIIEPIGQDKEFCGQKDALGKDNGDLKAPIETHNTFWPSKNSSSTITRFDSLDSEFTLDADFPTEVWYRILGFVLQLSRPIIDPGVKILQSNVTESEHAEQQCLPIQFLRVSKAFNDQGTELLFSKNEFLFTQVSSLRWLVKTHPKICAELKHLKLRIVGRYYDDRINEHSLLGYYGYQNQLNINIIKRCPSVNVGCIGLQSYSWRQIFDFLEALQFPNEPEELINSGERKTAFNLKSLMIDLANFGDELPGPGIALRKLTRGKLGPILDEIYIRGLNSDSNDGLASECLGFLVRDGGLKGQSIFPRFTSTINGPYLEFTDLAEFDEILMLYLKNFAKTQPESKEEQKYVWKQLSNTFAGFEGDKVQFHVGSGFAVDVSEGNERVMIHDETRQPLDELMAKRVRVNHDEDLADDIMESIYGPTSDTGGGRLLQDFWDSSNGELPDAQVCDNCGDMYVYFGGQPLVLGRNEMHTAEAEYFWEPDHDINEVDAWMMNERF